MDKDKAKNYSDRSNNNSDTNDNDSGDGDSNGNNKDNEAHRCAGRRGLLTPINGQLKTKYAAKYYL